MTLADILRGGLYAIDTPGALTRAGVANLADYVRGEDRHQGWRATGRDVLESMGMDRNQPGLDVGDVAGVGVEMALDPLNWGGLGWALKLAKAGRAAKANNALRAERLATGGMPEEVAKLTKVVDASGTPKRMYHGTAHAFDKYDMAKANPDSLFGPGIYTTDATAPASGYTGADVAASTGPDARWLYDTLMSQGRNPNVRMQYIDARKPWIVEDFLDDEEQALRSILESRRVRQQGWVGDAMDQQFADDIADFGPSTSRDHAWRMLDTHVGNPNDVLRELGYDSIRHTGGQITGGAPHDVWVAFDPSQIYSPWVAPAEQAVPSAGPMASILAAYNAQKAIPRQ